MWMHRVVYGDRHGAHALLAHSMTQSDNMPFLHQLEGTTDRAGTPPPGMEWAPYLSGYPHGRFYVLSRTFPHETASRLGMVRTYALLVATENVGSITALRDLVRLLPSDLVDSREFAATPV